MSSKDTHGRTETTHTADAQGRTRRRPRPTAGYSAGSAIDRYVVKAKLGYGGMGVVYRAHDPELDRDVAIKLLPVIDDGDLDRRTLRRERLLREAQALAQLSHPNVVSVHDAGTVGDAVFMAMELVEGQPLGDWLRDDERTVQQILRAFTAAGDGLSAAHRASLVHRDFKPSNVIVGSDDRPRVLDFGLVRLDAEHDHGETAFDSDDSGSSSSSGSRLTEELTAVGHVMGTPRYMSPEQHIGASTDARSDQFSFCVALWEALYGAHPFGADASLPYRAAVLAGAMKRPPPDRRVPRHVRRALERGLSRRPADRYPSMDSLLAALRTAPWARTRHWLPAVAAVAVVGVGGMMMWQLRDGSSAPCKEPRDRWAGVWDDARKQQVRAAFMATKVAYADEAYVRVERSLDDYARQWTAMRIDACKATHVRGEQSDAMLDLRTSCLSDRFEGVRVQVELLASADETIVKKSAQAVREIPGLRACADTTALSNRVVPPASREAQQALSEIHSDVQRANALFRSGQYERAETTSATALARARELDNAPAIAEASLALGRVRQQRGKGSEAASLFRAAMRAAEASGDDELAAWAGTRYVYVLGDALDRYDEALEWGLDVEAKVERLGDPDVRRGQLLFAMGSLHMRKGHYDQAADTLERSRAALENAAAETAPLRFQVLNFLAITEWYRLDYARAAEYFEQALTLGRDIFGPRHPSMSSTLANSGSLLAESGDLAGAKANYQAALELVEETYGQRHPNAARLRNNLGDVERALGNHKTGLAHYQRALEIWHELGDPSQAELATVHHNLGWQYLALDDHDLAREHFTTARTLRLEVNGRDHPFLAEDLVGAAAVELAAERFDDALSYYQRALDVCARGKTSRCSAEPKVHAGIGRVHLARHAPARAVASLERAVEQRASLDGDPVDLAADQFALARALWDSAQDRPRSIALAATARDAYAGAGDRAANERKTVETWLHERQ